eukprot:GHRR01021630.1.p2 GENE.GHRR01021630.1~~GHRR01021630.1.p2  ORF type:complete len:139 (+),score=32.27 GHRR01021630.1:473-889(+)
MVCHKCEAGKWCRAIERWQERHLLAELQIYVDYKADESYTPSRLAVRAGTTYHDLKDVCVVELKEPIGWTVIPLADQQTGKPIRAFAMQVAVLANHQNGRDTHIRQICLFGAAASSNSSLSSTWQFNTVEFNCFSVIR